MHGACIKIMIWLF